MSEGWSRLPLTLPDSFVDWICAEVVEWGAPGVEVLEQVEEEDLVDLADRPGLTTLNIYFPSDEVAEQGRKLTAFMRSLGTQAEPWRVGATESTPEVDWAEQWRYHFPPLEVGERLLILPPWEQDRDPGGRVPVVLQPGMAFGTGHHPTTDLVLQELESSIPALSAGTVLDIGCGSGILSIGSVALGAGKVTAVDHDRDAVASARSNARLNAMSDRIAVVRAKFPSLPFRVRFELVVANVYFTFFTTASRSLASVIEPGGVLLASGLREEEGEATLGELRDSGLEAEITGECDGWIVIRGVMA